MGQESWDGCGEGGGVIDENSNLEIEVMHTKISYGVWQRFRSMKLTSDERVAALWGMTIASAIGFVPNDVEQMRMDTGIQTDPLESSMDKMQFTQVHGGWIIPGYISEQIGRGTTLAANPMSHTIVKHIARAHQSIRDAVLAEHPILKSMLDEFCICGKISKRIHRTISPKQPIIPSPPSEPSEVEY